VDAERPLSRRVAVWFAVAALAATAAAAPGCGPLPRDQQIPTRRAPPPGASAEAAAPAAPAAASGAVASVTVDPAAILRAADDAGAAGEWMRSAALVRALDITALDPADRVEAYRVRGLAEFFTGALPQAEADLLAWLRVDQDARLDPTLIPPEAVTFLEDVRARHAVELRALRPRGRRWWALNLLPPWGQFQNGDRTKGWVIAGAGAALLTVDLSTFALLSRWCDSHDLTCDAHGDRAGTARTLRTVNLVAGSALIALYAYGVLDGYWHFRSRAAIVVMPSGDGAQVWFSGSF
jgi:hypothetical protein